MKKYKLIKIYPGSPILGTIWEYRTKDFSNYPEFWQEVIEKEYQMVKYSL